MSPERLEELRAMERGATAAPWSFDEDGNIIRIHGTAWWTSPQAGGEVPSYPVTMQIAKIRKHDDQYQPYWPEPRDLKMIIEGRNAFRELLDEIERLKERERVLTEKVGKARDYFDIKKLGRLRYGRESQLFEELSSVLGEPEP